VADHICETLFAQDSRVLGVTVKIIKLAISENGERIGITLHRDRR
jgi:dihydroneopterin aldolase